MREVAVAGLDLRRLVLLEELLVDADLVAHLVENLVHLDNRVLHLTGEGVSTFGMDPAEDR